MFNRHLEACSLPRETLRWRCALWGDPEVGFKKGVYFVFRRADEDDGVGGAVGSCAVVHDFPPNVLFLTEHDPSVVGNVLSSSGYVSGYHFSSIPHH